MRLFFIVAFSSVVFECFCMQSEYCADLMQRDAQISIGSKIENVNKWRQLVQEREDFFRYSTVKRAIESKVFCLSKKTIDACRDVLFNLLAFYSNLLNLAARDNDSEGIEFLKRKRILLQQDGYVLVRVLEEELLPALKTQSRNDRGFDKSIDWLTSQISLMKLNGFGK